MSVVLASSAGAVLFPTSGVVGGPGPGESVVEGVQAAAPDRGQSGSRGLDRPDPPPSGIPGGAPTQVAEATLTARMVNGRAQPELVESPQSGAGKYNVVSGGSPPASDGEGQLVRYLVEVEDGLPFDQDEFAEVVHGILTDERGWGRDGWQFERVAEAPVDFRVALSSPDLTDAECDPLQTLGKVSCWNGERAVINAQRWGVGADTYGDDLLSYREYLINHEVGHALGNGHLNCPGDGEPAPVMVQQTKSLEGCDANQWPFP